MGVLPTPQAHKLIPHLRAFALAVPHAWNSLPPDLPMADSSSSFGSPVKGGEVHPDHPTMSLSVMLLLGFSLELITV